MGRRHVALLLLAACLLQACGFGPGEAQEGAGVELRVTRDFGQERISSAEVDQVRASDTVMRLLRRHESDVRTAYGGRFVQAIGDLEGAGAEGHFDWFFYVNGRLLGASATDTSLHPGDVVQWDYRDWQGAMDVFAIVGAFPEPFLHGFEGRRLPARVACADPGAEACATVKASFDEAGVTATGAPLEAPAGAETLRVLVGPWSRLRALRAATPLEQGPDASGVFARFEAAGARLVLLDAAGEPVRTLDAGGLVAATAAPDQAPTWFVTGIDPAGVDAAARMLAPDVLADKFAIAVEDGRARALPLEQGGDG